LPEAYPLIYAPPPRPWHRRERARRVLALVAIAILSLASYRWGPPVWNQARMLYWQRECLAFTPPPGQMVWDDGLPSGGSMKTPHGAAPPVCWARLQRCIGGTGAPGALALLHELRSKNGVRRLVAIGDTGMGGLMPLCVVIEPGSLRTSPKVVNVPVEVKLDDVDPEFLFLSASQGPHASTRIFAAQLDPGDAAHFTIRFEYKGRSSVVCQGSVDGYLEDDGNLIRCVFKTAPPAPTHALAGNISLGQSVWGPSVGNMQIDIHFTRATSRPTSVEFEEAFLNNTDSNPLFNPKASGRLDATTRPVLFAPVTRPTSAPSSPGRVELTPSFVKSFLDPRAIDPFPEAATRPSTQPHNK
jgi:hypothetical protein